MRLNMLNLALKKLVLPFAFIYILPMGYCNVKVSDALYARLQALAGQKGYSSVEEMIIHILEKTADNADCELDSDRIKHQLKGLGYFNG